jgi:hypothetical protein
MVFNLAAGVPVWLCIGIFSLYHLYCAAGNSTTIEGWEKDRVATLVRRGKIKEVSVLRSLLDAFQTLIMVKSDQIKYPYVSRASRNPSPIYRSFNIYIFARRISVSTAT